MVGPFPVSTYPPCHPDGQQVACTGRLDVIIACLSPLADANEYCLRPWAGRTAIPQPVASIGPGLSYSEPPWEAKRTIEHPTMTRKLLRNPNGPTSPQGSSITSPFLRGPLGAQGLLRSRRAPEEVQPLPTEPPKISQGLPRPQRARRRSGTQKVPPKQRAPKHFQDLPNNTLRTSKGHQRLPRPHAAQKHSQGLPLKIRNGRRWSPRSPHCSPRPSQDAKPTNRIIQFAGICIHVLCGLQICVHKGNMYNIKRYIYILLCFRTQASNQLLQACTYNVIWL